MKRRTRQLSIVTHSAELHTPRHTAVIAHPHVGHIQIHIAAMRGVDEMLPRCFHNHMQAVCAMPWCDIEHTLTERMSTRSRSHPSVPSPPWASMGFAGVDGTWRAPRLWVESVPEGVPTVWGSSVGLSRVRLERVARARLRVALRRASAWRSPWCPWRWRLGGSSRAAPS